MQLMEAAPTHAAVLLSYWHHDLISSFSPAEREAVVSYIASPELSELYALNAARFYDQPDKILELLKDYPGQELQRALPMTETVRVKLFAPYDGSVAAINLSSFELSSDRKLAETEVLLKKTEKDGVYIIDSVGTITH